VSRQRERIEPRPPEALPVAAVLPQAGVSNAAVARLLARDAATEEEPPITAPGITGMQQWLARAEAHMQAKRWEKAIAAYEEAYRHHPISTFLRDQAEALEHLNRADEAADLYERYLAEGPLMADVQRIRSRIRKLRGEQVPEGEDDDLPPITAKGKAGAEGWFDRAQARFVSKRFAEAAECFRNAYALLPLPEFLFDEGTALEKGGHPAAAANAFEHYLVVASGAPDAKEVVEKVKALRGQAPVGGPDALIDPEDEAAEAPAVTAKGAEGARQLHERATVAYLVGDFHRAYETWVQAYDLKLAPGFVYNQAAALQHLGNIDAAVQAYERYLALDPKAKDAGEVRRLIQRLRAGAGAEIKAP
jgi:tetratricopeptide (TPR) repeat protein